MRAVRWHGNRDVRVEDVDLGLALGPGMIEVAVAWCGVCGSDVAEYAHGPFAIRPGHIHRLTGQEPPITLGHEFSGRVTAVGPGAGDVAVGDRVAADACWRCETCVACVAGAYNQCVLSGSIGLASDGAMASHIRFPAYCAVPLPEAVTDRAGALLEPLAVALHALRRGGAAPGETVVVLGFGAIGACTAEIAGAMGLTVLVSEPGRARRARAEQLGHATIAPDGSPREVAKAIRARTGGGAHLVVDASGVPAALEAAPEMTVRGGRVALVGIPKTSPPIDAARLVLYERSLIASLGYAHDLPRVAAMIAAGHVDPERLITRTIGLEETPGALERLATAPDGDIKVLIEVGGG
ncbi:MAG TPA: alcohol dehydrogenase catalytic domain-containing protein [Solirubrobacteraceae bacterium]|jgi:(R,R)-butanediol dehydrogenase/meso-butanediol dehydrogenase/diacetyl reductase|nr:alcohol dehydrogenase catalytic domain-containing protein [Solirubrobacteraceae bacterium]